jgi:hypothetical protein
MARPSRTWRSRASPGGRSPARTSTATRRRCAGSTPTVTLKPPGKNVQQPPLSAGYQLASQRAGQTGRYVWIDRGDGKGPAADLGRADDPVRLAEPRHPEGQRPGDPPGHRARPGRRDVRGESGAARVLHRRRQPDVDPMDDDEIDAFLAEYGAMRQLQPYGWIPGTVKRADVSAPSPRDLTLVDLQRQVTLEIANGLGVDPEDLGVSDHVADVLQLRRQEAGQGQPDVRPVHEGDHRPPRHGRRDPPRLRPAVRPDRLPQVGPGHPGRLLESAEGHGRDRRRRDPRLGRPVRSGPEAAAAGRAARCPGRPRPGSTAPRWSRCRFSASDFGDAAPAPKVDQAARTITGLAVPYNAVADKGGHEVQRSSPARWSTPTRRAWRT